MDDWLVEQYLVYSRSRRFTKKVDEARSFIRAALLDHAGTWAVNISGGKDSGVLLDLCYAAGWRGPLVYMVYAETPTENSGVVQEAAQRYQLLLHTVPVPGAWDVFRTVGHFFVQPVTPEEKAATAKMLKAYKKRVNDFAQAQAWTGDFLGLRAEESRPRRIMLSGKGRLYQTKIREAWTACPLAWWKSDDIWAYTLSRELPYLAVYDRTPDLAHTRSETTYLAAPSLWRHGFAAWLKRYQPEEWKRIVAVFPDVQTYV